MTLHISGTVTGPVVLGPNSKHLTTITNTGAVNSTGIGVDGIDGPAGNRWPIENDGTITASGGLGISLAAGGSVDNGASALISGGIAGILINGAAGAVANAGSIYGAGTGNTVVNSTLVISGDGVAFLAGGSVTNAGSGSISGHGARGVGDSSGSGVFITGGSARVTNSGNINATAYGVALDSGGGVTNTSTGSIQGVEDGVKISNQPGAVTNAGSIVAKDDPTRGGDDGVALFAGGTVTNGAGALIQSGSGFGTPLSAAGVFTTNGSGSVANSGSIKGTIFGALLTPGSIANASGTVTNSASGAISGGEAGVAFNIMGGALVNAGQISASGAGGAGADLEAGGSVTNSAGGSISGTLFGVLIAGGSGTIANAGTLSGGVYAAKFSGGGTNTLLVEPGAVFVGAIGGALGASNTLESVAGSNAAIGSLINFQTLAVDPGSAMTLNGATVVPTVLDNGTLEITDSLDVSTAIDPASTGVFRLDSGSVLDVAAAVGARTMMSFIGPSELAIDDVGAFGSQVGDPLAYSGPLLAQFGAGDVIDLKNFGFAGVSLSPLTSNGVLHITNASVSGSRVADLKFDTSTLGAGHFQASSDGGAGALITLEP
ncbi:MAG: hypothetical protein J0H14_05840 [Alphaproteobacteria bacterium]|nr:hypothetical protein [Alphaproteobacteria bacterium]